MILKYYGETGDDSVPERFRLVQYFVIGKDDERVFVLVAVKTNSGDMHVGYPNKGEARRRLSMKVSDKFHELRSYEIDRRISEKSNSVDKFTAEELDDILEKACDEVLKHHVGQWSLTYSGDELNPPPMCAKIVDWLKDYKHRAMEDIRKNCHVSLRDVEWTKGLLRDIGRLSTIPGA